MSKKFNFLILLLTCSYLVYAIYLFLPITIDDAFITFTYAKNVALGNGFVFSNGDRVEATSSFFWMLLLSICEIIGIGSVIASKILGIIFFFLSLLVSFYSTKIRLQSGTYSKWLVSPAILAFVLSSFTTSSLAWVTQGMETSMVGFLFLLSAHLFSLEIVSGKGLYSLIGIFLFHMSRPEAFVFTLFFILFRVLYSKFTNRLYSKFLWLWLIYLITAVVIYESWGIYYYGHLLPNTVSAKFNGLKLATILNGVSYVTSRAGLQVLVASFLSFFLVIFSFNNNLFKKQNPHLTYFLSIGSLMIFMQIFFAIFTGGDSMPTARFFSTVGPLLGSVFVLSLITIRKNFFWRYILFSIIFSYISYGIYLLPIELHISKKINESSEIAIMPLIKYVNEFADEDDILSASDVGRLGYYYKGKIFDWWGLASPIVVERNEAIGKIKPKTVLEQYPRYIILYLAAPNLKSPNAFDGVAKRTKEFIEYKDFIDKYKLRKVTKFSSKRYHALFERIDMS